MEKKKKRASNLFSCSASTFGTSAERLVLIFRVFVWDSVFLLPGGAAPCRTGHAGRGELRALECCRAHARRLPQGPARGRGTDAAGRLLAMPSTRTASFW